MIQEKDKMDIGECTNCFKWGEVPKTFKETKHFLKCPACKCAMYLVRLAQPNELRLRESDKVEITEFINHKG